MRLLFKNEFIYKIFCADKNSKSDSLLGGTSVRLEI